MNPENNRPSGIKHGIVKLRTVGLLANLLLALGPAIVAIGVESGTESARSSVSKSFPDVNEVLQGRVFESKFERDVFFLRQIRNQYPAHWDSLLEANLTLKDYAQAPDKMLRFLQELGFAMKDTDDLITATNLAVVVLDANYYANPEAYRPEIQRTAADSLIKLGPRGRQQLATAFNTARYQTNSSNLELLAEAVGSAGISESDLSAALCATAFSFSLSNGAYYPRCTKVAAKNLLRSAEGTKQVRKHLTPGQALEEPGRFQSIMEAIAEAGPLDLATNLVAISAALEKKLNEIKNSPEPYRDDLLGLQNKLKNAIEVNQGVTH